MGSSVILPVPGQPVKGPDPNFKSGSLPNVTTFNWKLVGPPVSIYVQRDDVLLIQAISLLLNETINVQYRQLLAPFVTAGQPDAPVPQTDAQVALGSNTIQPGGRTFALVGNFSSNIFSIPLTEGYLLSVAVTANVAQFRGQTFVRVFLARGGTAGANEFAGLCGDYCTLVGAAAWPNGRWNAPSESSGWVHSVQVANPAAGADWTLTQSAGGRKRIDSFSAQLVTSAAAGNRNVEVIVDDGANTVWRTSAPASVAASTTQLISATGSNNPTGVVTTDFSVVIPPGLILGSAWRVRTATTGIQVGDQWSNIWFNVEDYADGL